MYDSLEIVAADKTSLHIHGRAVNGSTDNNLVLRAYNLLKGLYPDVVKPVEIHLLKTLPMGAGLGGGSADGAFMLVMMNRYFELGISKGDLAKISLQLGSDCPFFVYNTPHYATGRGEELQPIDIDLSNYSLVFICPGIHVSTAEAFTLLNPKPAPVNLKELYNMPIANWRDIISNDFEAPVFAKHPELARIKEDMYNKGAIYASMSGSGSTIYGIFEKGITPQQFHFPYEVIIV